METLGFVYNIVRSRPYYANGLEIMYVVIFERNKYNWIELNFVKDKLSVSAKCAVVCHIHICHPDKERNTNYTLLSSEFVPVCPKYCLYIWKSCYIIHDIHVYALSLKHWWCAGSQQNNCAFFFTCFLFTNTNEPIHNKTFREWEEEIMAQSSQQFTPVQGQALTFIFAAIITSSITMHY